MGDASLPLPTKGIFRFGIPDFSIPPDESCLYAFPANKQVIEESLVLHDVRDNPDLLPGAAGLDAQGFTFVKHKSALSENGPLSWFEGNNVEDVYFSEVEKLVLELTGAKKAAVHNLAFRRKPADKQTDKSYFFKRGEPLDIELAKLPKDKAVVSGKDESGALEPNRTAHVDFTIKGLRDTARYCRREIALVAQETLDVEDTAESGTDVPRYTVYSVWRPLRPVRRDPLSVLDFRTLDPSELQTITYRALSEITDSGEFMIDASTASPPKHPHTQKWYWMPDQQADDVLVLKLADTKEGTPGDVDGVDVICGGAVHVSPIVPGTENEEHRASVEARVMAFW